jgi:pimeloyl-ACP methyl ester carboxylesterase
MLNRITTSFDGVRIAYSVSGVADTALVFIHGGMADRSFWDGQHAAFSESFRVIDLAGQGSRVGTGRNGASHNSAVMSWR